MQYLIIAEKPSVSRAIQVALGNQYKGNKLIYIPLHGHITEMVKPDEYSKEWGTPWRLELLPMVPNPFKYRATDKKLLKQIKETVKQVDGVINATDPGREGEAIFWNMWELIKSSTPVRRLWAKDQTSQSIKDAMDNLLDYSNKDLANLKESAILRQEIDWLWGMNQSRFFSLITGEPTSVGRVMTPTLKLIHSRELAIRNFQSSTSYYLEGQFEEGNEIYVGQTTHLKSRADAEKLRQALTSPFVVKSYKEKELVTQPPLLPDLADLQIKGNQLFGFSAQQTLDTLQSLYEKGYISYPRTDSRYLTQAVADEAPKVLGVHLGSLTGVNPTKDLSRYVNEQKVVDHYAIIPTTKKPEALLDRESKLYDYICNRFISIFMDPMVKEKCDWVIEDDGGMAFKGGETWVSSPGFGSLLYGEKIGKARKSLIPGNTISCNEITIKTSKTQPPKYYTEASLIKAMQNPSMKDEEDVDKELESVMKDVDGIGTPATRAAIIEKLKKKRYIKLVNKQIRMQTEGNQVIEATKESLVQNVSFTARMEKNLRALEDGKINSSNFKQEVIKIMSDQFEEMENSISNRVDNTYGVSLGVCPVCGGKVINAKKYYKCENYKSQSGIACDFTLPGTLCKAHIQPEDVKALLDGEETREITDFIWKSGKQGAAKLRLNKEGKIEFIFPEREPYEKETVGTCPKCGHDVEETKKFYKCVNYKADENPCDFIVAKTICASPITKKDIKTLLNGDTTDKKTFTWRSGKQGEAKLKLDDSNLEFIFDD